MLIGIENEIKDQEVKTKELSGIEKSLISKTNLLALLSDKLLMTEESAKTRR